MSPAVSDFSQVDVAAEITKLKKQLESYKPLEEAVLALQAHVPPPPSKQSRPKALPKKERVRCSSCACA